MIQNTLPVIYAGKLSFLWNDGMFCFSYELKFEDSEGNLVEPRQNSFEIINQYEPDQILSYDYITDCLFPQESGISLFQIFSIYISSPNLHECITVNRQLFEEFVRIQKSKLVHQSDLQKPRERRASNPVSHNHKFAPQQFNPPKLILRSPTKRK